MWLMLNKHLLGKGLSWSSRRTRGQTTHHWKELEGCSTGPGNCIHGFGVHSTLVPLYSPWFSLPPGCFGLPLCLYDISVSLHVPFWHYHYHHLQLLFCYCHARCARTHFSNNNFSHFLKKDGKSPSSNAWRKSLFGCGFYLKLNTPPMPTQDGNSFQFPRLGQCRDLLSSSSDLYSSSLSLSFSISWNSPQIKTLPFDLDFCICCPDSGLYYCIFPHSSPL